MKFGLESEKFVLDMSDLSAAQSTTILLEEARNRSTPELRPEALQPEFVQSILEFNSLPSADPILVLADYVLHFTETRKVARELGFDFVPLASLPLIYTPVLRENESIRHQQSVLSGHRFNVEDFRSGEGLLDAGNCAGIHVHAELESKDESELMNKFNFGNALTPLIAFASSPYFQGVSEARSMRGKRYYYHVYRHCPMNGGPVPMLEDYLTLTNYLRHSELQWLALSHGAGLDIAEGLRQVEDKGVHWNPLRWNQRWNTIELRCLDSGSLEHDCAKFLLVTAAFKRLAIHGEALRCRLLPDMDLGDVIRRSFEVQRGTVALPGTKVLHELFFRAIENGLRDPYVFAYLRQLFAFVRQGESDLSRSPLICSLEDQLASGLSPSEEILRDCGHLNYLDPNDAQRILREQMAAQEQRLQALDLSYFLAGGSTSSRHSSFTDSVRFQGPAKRTPGPASNSSAS